MDKSHRTPLPAAAMASSSAAPSFVPLDADELLDRLFLGRLDEWHFQALALTVLDPRRLAPALESARERPDNLRGACETHEVAPWTADDLIGRWGFRSLSLAALITDQWLADREMDLGPSECARVKVMALKLNDRRPLEPLYGLKRLMHHRAKRTAGGQKGSAVVEALDLAGAAAEGGGGWDEEASVKRMKKVHPLRTFKETFKEAIEVQKKLVLATFAPGPVEPAGLYHVFRNGASAHDTSAHDTSAGRADASPSKELALLDLGKKGRGKGSNKPSSGKPTSTCFSCGIQFKGVNVVRFCPPCWNSQRFGANRFEGTSDCYSSTVSCASSTTSSADPPSGRGNNGLLSGGGSGDSGISSGSSSLSAGGGGGGGALGIFPTTRAGNFMCPNSPQGCHFVGPAASVRYHAAHDCACATCACPWLGCPFQGATHWVSNHLTHCHRQTDFLQPVEAARNRMASMQVQFLVRIPQQRLFPGLSLAARPDPRAAGPRGASTGGSPGKDGQPQSWSPLYWEPRRFCFDQVTFFQMLYRRVEEYQGKKSGGAAGAKKQRVRFYFWIWSLASPKATEDYYYTLTIPRGRLEEGRDYSGATVEEAFRYQAVAKSLQVPMDDLLASSTGNNGVVKPGGSGSAPAAASGPRGIVFFDESLMKKNILLNDGRLAYQLKMIRP